MLLFCDTAGVAHVIDYSRKNSRRVARSIIVAEVAAFFYTFDAAYMI